MSLLIRLRPTAKAFLRPPSPALLSNPKFQSPSSPTSVNNSRCFSAASIYTSLSNSAPVSAFQESLVQLHDTTGLPWWATIVLSTVLLRSVITLPLTIYQQKISARIEMIAAEMPDIVKELKQEAMVAKKRFQWTDQQTKNVYNRSVKKQWDRLVVRENCHPLKTFIVLWGQIPLWVVQSIALRNLLYLLPDPNSIHAKMAFTELTLGGFGWIPNLTEVDSSLILPVTLGLLNLAIVEIQTITRARKERTKFQIYATNLFRGVSIAMIPIAASVPSALCLYWSASSAYGLAQNLLLLSPNVRRKFGIPHTKSELAHPYSHINDVLAARLSSVQLKATTLFGNQKPTSPS